MAKHEVIIRENGSSSKTSAPYLPSYVKKGDVAGDRLFQLVAAEAGLTETQVRAIFEGAFAEFEALEQEGAVRIHVDGMTVCLAITGSFASADAAFDPLKNTLELAIYLDDDIRNALVNVTPAIVTDETATVVRLTVVSDTEIPRPYEVIYGQRPFDVQAVNNVTTDEGASAYFEGANGTTYPATLVSSTSRQLSRYKSATLLEGGDYKFWIKSRGGDAEGPLQAKFRRVKYIRITPPPTVTKVTGDGDIGLMKACPYYAYGTDLSFNASAGDKVTAKWTEGGVEKTLEPVPTAVTPTKLTFPATDAWNNCDSGTKVTFTFKLGTTTLTVETEVAGA